VTEPGRAEYLFRVVAAERATGWQVVLAPGRHAVGSAAGGKIVLDEPGVSRRHAEIEVLADGGAVVRDLGSKNGTYVDGRRVREVAVGDAATLAIGSVRARLDRVGEAAGDPWLAPAGAAVRATPAIGASAGSAGRGRRSAWLVAARTTEGLRPVERLSQTLAEVLPSLVAGGVSAEEGAHQLAERWLATLPLGRVEILRRTARGDVVVAAASTSGAGGAGAAPGEGMRMPVSYIIYSHLDSILTLARY
jgi:hypothetical protein